MLYVDNHNEHDPAINLALEEYVLRNAHGDDDLLLLYVNAPSIIIGRHQNAFEEINRDFVERHGIQVVRRLSGGGAVYHDLGNLNFSLVTVARPENFRNYGKLTEPVVQVLGELGVPAVLNARNDLMVDGRKVTGTAQYISRGRMVSHGTLLFSSDLSAVSEALQVKEDEITSKAIKSVRSRVANICEYLSQPLEIDRFRELLLAHIFSGESPPPVYDLTADDWAAIYQLADDRFRSWEWNYGHSPDFTVKKHRRFPGGDIDACIIVQQGIIRSAALSGDFFASAEPEPLANLLVGVRYWREAVIQALQNESIATSLPGLDLPSLGAFLS